MKQPSLFDPPRLPQPFDVACQAVPVRKSDPETSAEAVRKHFASGRAQTNEMIVLRLLAANDGSTYRELHAAQGDKPAIADHVEVTRRLNGLEKMGLARKDPHLARPCRVNGNRMQLWFITKLGLKYLNGQKD